MIFLLLFAIGLFIAVILAVCDVFWPFTVTLVCGWIAAWYLGHLQDIRPLLRPDLIVGYIVLGLAWVFFKWTRLVEDEIKRARNLKTINPQPPRWSHHADAFIAYFFYWPLDLIAYVLDDLLSDAWKWISRMVTQSFDRYAEWRFKSLTSKGR